MAELVLSCEWNEGREDSAAESDRTPVMMTGKGRWLFAVGTTAVVLSVFLFVLWRGDIYFCLRGILPVLFFLVGLAMALKGAAPYWTKPPEKRSTVVEKDSERLTSSSKIGVGPVPRSASILPPRQ